MKSASDSAPPRANKWRLKRTLKRAVDFRPIEDQDIRWIFAAYKKGDLGGIGEKFKDGLMGADEFKIEFQKYVLENFHAVWTLFGQTSRGVIPLGIVFATWAPGGSYMIVNGMCWFPWSSKRNKIEAMVNFLSGIRSQFQLMFFAAPEHKRMYEVCMMHGIVRRIGTSNAVFPGKSAAVFETRAVK